ncbi:MAG: hypothetical protein ACFFDH_15060 [Promethearchaeota archaeon]
MSDKKKIIEQLKKDYKKAQGGLGGLNYSASPMAHDKMFEKQADRFLQSQQPSIRPHTTSSSRVDWEKLKIEAGRAAAQDRARKQQLMEGAEEFGRQCIPEISAYREAMIKFSKEGNVKAVEKWCKDGLKRIDELFRNFNSKYYWKPKEALELVLRKELGAAHIKMNELGKAKKQYLKMLKELRNNCKKRNWYKNPIEMYSINYGTIWDWEIKFDSIALLFMNIGDYNTTESLFREALKKDVRTKDLNTKALRELYIGVALLAKGNTKKANKIFERVSILTSQNTTLATKVNEFINNAKKKFNH